MTNMTEFYSRIYWLNKSDSLTTPLGKTNLNHMDSAIKTLDGRTVELYTEAVRLDTTKADKNQLKGMVTNWQIDDRTGIVTLTKYDGTKVSINTALNQLAVNFDYDAVNQQLVITQTDGTQKIVDMSALITQYEFLDTDTVSFFVDENGKVSAKVKEGSIEEKHLQPNYLADIKVETAKAQGYATDAQESAGNAAYDAKLSQSYAVGGSGIRENEDVDNAREYAKKAKESADTAQELVGGKFIPADEKGAASGVATLDENSKVPKEQLPDLVIDGKKLINAFSTRPSTLNVDNSAEPYKNGVTYMMATLAANDSGTKPLGLDAYVFNLAWDEYKYGCQVAFSDSVPYARAFMRCSDRNGNWLNWNEMLTTTNFRPIVYQITAGNEINLASGISAVTSDYLWINYRDAGTNALVSGSKITKYILGNGNGSRASLECAGLILSTPPDNLPISSVPFVLGFVNGTTKLKIVQRNNFMQAKNLNGFYGMVVGNYEDNVWVRTTTQGIIPYQSGGRGSGHQELGTDSWYFLKSHIDQMHGVTLDLSGTITSRVNTSAYITGAKGVNVGINMLNAGSGYTILATLKSTNGVFCIGQYQGIIHIYYIANSLINANTNDVTKDLKLFNESGNSVFPGTVTAKGGFSSGVSSSFNTADIATAIITTLTVNGSVRLKKSGSNYGMKLNFGDGEYVYLHENSDDYLTIYAKNGIYFKTATQRGTDGILFQGYTSDNHFYFQPLTDGYGNIGSPGNRFNQFYAKNSGISTSDRTLKKDISYFGKNSRYDTYMDDETLRNFVSGLLPCIYRLIENENNRPHHGFIAQDIEELMRQLGIKDHAGFIKSPKTEIIENEEEVEEEYVDEADGQTKTRTVIHKSEEQREIPGEYIYGLRYEEFIADIVRFVQIQDERIEEQEKIIQGQQEEIDSLKARLERLEALMLY